MQEQYRGHSNADTWTHGLSEQCQKWLTRGLENGSIATCNTRGAKTV
ncbi:neutral zinc metallopeptidase [Schaalia turicensis]